MSEPLPSSDFEHIARIARIARALFDVPLAVLILPETSSRPHAVRAGLSADETERLLAAAETAADGGDRCAFFASAALPGGGQLCLLDGTPRAFDATGQALLDDLAALAAPRAVPQPERALLPLLDELDDGMILLDGERRVSWANRSAALLVGDDAAALAGRRAQDFVVDAVAGMVDADPAGAVVTREMTGRRAGGATVSLEVAACALGSGSGRRYAAIVRDAAGRHEQAWRARAASERRHKTFSMASHELRTPLASIIGFTELLLKREFDATTARELLEIVHAQATLMSTLVNGVLDLARIEAGGRQALRVEPAPIDAVLVQALANVEALGQNDRVHLDVAPGLPPVAGDRHRLQTAFAHVLSNAIRYSEAGQPVTVRAWSDPAPGAAALLVRIADLGAGMTLEERARLFEPFFRGSAGRAAAEAGLGLGMAIFKETVDVHNGTVEIESSPGSGTAVTVRLPLAAGGTHG